MKAGGGQCAMERLERDLFAGRLMANARHYSFMNIPRNIVNTRVRPLEKFPAFVMYSIYVGDG